MERPIRVHLGSGIHKWPSAHWINIDSVGDVDIQHDIRKLPMFEDGTVDEIQAIHVFEHINRLEIDAVLTEWKRVLKPGGKLIMEMPSLDKIARLIVDGERNLRLTILGIYGDPREHNPLMLHQWGWTYWELEKVLTNRGFTPAFKEPVFHIKERDLRVEATRI